MISSRSTVTILACAGLLGVMPAAAQTPTYRVTDLSAAPGARLCVATAINDAGMTTGSCGESLETNEGAASWRSGTLTKLGKMRGGNYAGGTAINSNGVVAGEGDTGDWQPRPFVVRNGRLLNLDDQGGANMRVVGMMDNGVVFANYAKGLSGSTSAWNPVYYVEEASKPGRFRRYALPRTPAGDTSVIGVYAHATNKVGQVVGDLQSTSYGQKGAFWNNDSKRTLVALEPLAGATQSIALGISDLGQAVGESYFAFAGYRATLWNNDSAHTATDLGMLPGDVQSIAMAVNNAGQVVGVSASATGQPRGFLYQHGQMFDLATLVAPEDGAWTITAVFAINNNGQILALGENNGRFASILLTPALQ
jgi:probable HAF family extracellular repeat protein